MSGIWSPPVKPWVRVNFDADCSASSNTASTGVVVRDHNGLLLGSACFWYPIGSSPLVAEAMACIRAVAFTRDLGFRSVEFEGDSAQLLTKLRAPEIDRSIVSPLIWEIKLVLAFEQFNFQHIKRGGNQVAHLHPREGSLRRRDVFWVEQGPSSITDAVASVRNSSL